MSSWPPPPPLPPMHSSSQPPHQGYSQQQHQQQQNQQRYPPPPPTPTGANGGGYQPAVAAPPPPPQQQYHNNFNAGPPTTTTTTPHFQHATPPPPPPPQSNSSAQPQQFGNNRNNDNNNPYPAPPPPVPTSQSQMYPPPPPPQMMQHQQQQQQQHYPPQQYHQTTSMPPPPPPPPQPPAPSMHQYAHQQQQQQHHQNYPPTQPTPPPINQGIPTQSYQPPPMPAPSALPSQHRVIQPSEIPTVSVITNPQEQTDPPIYLSKIYQTNDDSKFNPPPPADTRFVAKDQGNASPNAMRSTMYGVPVDKIVWRNSGQIEMAVLCTPMMEQHDDLYLIDATEPNPPPRCNQCRAYLNAFWNVQYKTCNFCATKNSQLQLTGVRNIGTDEYLVNGPYITKPQLQPNTTIFVMDITCPHLQEYLSLIPTIIKNSILDPYFQHLQQQSQHTRNINNPLAQPRVGLVFCSALGIYIPTMDGTGYTVMPDVTQDPFCPIPLDQWTHNITTENGQQNWELCYTEQITASGPLSQLLKRVNEQRLATNYTARSYTCTGAALQFIQDALQYSGGHGIYFTWRRPNYGIGKLDDRTKKVTAALIPSQKLKDETNPTKLFYQKLGKACNDTSVSVSIVMHTHHEQYLDIPTHAELCRETCGTFLWLNENDDNITNDNYNDAPWKDKIVEEFSKPPMGWNAIMVIRCSEGLQVVDWVEPTLGTPVPPDTFQSPSSSTQLQWSRVTQHMLAGITLEHRVGGFSRAVLKQGLVFVQMALLYTHPWTMERRLKVSTLTLRIADTPTQVFKCLDWSTIVCTQYRIIVQKLLQHSIQESANTINMTIQNVRTIFTNWCVQILTNYRLSCKKDSSSVHSAQLLLPEKLELLPLFGTSLFKSPLLAKQTTRQSMSSQDQNIRSLYMYLATMSTIPSMGMTLVHPIILPIHQLPDSNGTGQYQNQNGLVKLPFPPIVPSISNLQDDGIYLIDAYHTIYIWVGKQISSTRRELLNSYLENYASEYSPEFNDRMGIGYILSRIIHQLKQHPPNGRPVAPKIVFWHQASPSSTTTTLTLPSSSTLLLQEQLMIADATSLEKDYIGYLTELHQLVRGKIEFTKQ